MVASVMNDAVQTLRVEKELLIQAPIDLAFEAILEELGPASEIPGGKSMPMVLEAWPGGRWYRDLGDNNGHFWANVQAIKRPSLLEFAGPLFASFPMVSNVQYRLSEVDGGTLIAFRHSALGFIPDDVKAGMNKGWAEMHEGIRKLAEAAASK